MGVISLLGKLIIGTTKGFIRGKALSVEGHTHVLNDIDTNSIFKINKFIDKTYSLDGNYTASEPLLIIDEELINANNIFLFSNGFICYTELNIKKAIFSENSQCIEVTVGDLNNQIKGRLAYFSVGAEYTNNIITNNKVTSFVIPTEVNVGDSNSVKSIYATNGSIYGDFIRADKYSLAGGYTVNLTVKISKSCNISGSSYLKLKIYTFSF